ncbi:hypothetical protein BU23DRAFT_552390, partial [Bimuria novae-zelandiae CBS 107.79]
ADGADGAGEVLTQDKLPKESAVHMPNEAPEEMTIAERDCTFGHNSDEGSILDVPSEAPADTRIESEAIVTPTRTLTGDRKAARQGNPLAEKEKVLDDGPGIRAGEVEEGTNPGLPPVMLPDYARCAAAIIYILITQHSENGESTQDRDSVTGKPSAAVLCNSDSPEDARDAKRGEIEDTTDETITVWSMK